MAGHPIGNLGNAHRLPSTNVENTLVGGGQEQFRPTGNILHPSGRPHLIRNHLNRLTVAQTGFDQLHDIPMLAWIRGPIDHLYPHDGIIPASLLYDPFSLRLLLPIDIDSSRPILLGIGNLLRALKHEVGREMNQPASLSVAKFHQRGHRLHIDGIGFGRMLLAKIDTRHRHGIENHLGPETSQQLFHRLPLAQIHLFETIARRRQQIRLTRNAQQGMRSRTGQPLQDTSANKPIGP